MSRRLEPPSGGEQPPATVDAGEAAPIDLLPLAERITDCYLAAYPDDVERYGPAGRAWSVHDTRWLLAWALEDAITGFVDCGKEVRWLGEVLVARDFPLERLARHVGFVADVLGDDPGGAVGAIAAARMRDAASSLGAQPSAG